MADNVTVEVLDAGNAVEVHVGTGGNIPSKWSVWNAEDHYVPLRSVTHLGSAYVCVKACTGVDPEADVALGDGTKGTYWLKTVSKGDAGKEGEDGFSPTVEVTKISGGNRMTITDAEGTKTLDVMDGERGSAGSPGADGFSPTVEVAEISGGHRVTITDAEETKTFDVMDGKRGAAGVAGAPGQDGVSVTHAWEGTVLKVTSASGTSSANLRGPAGVDGKDGSAGSPGADGFSPTVTIENVDVETGGTKVSITDKNGTKTFTVWNGLDGQDGAGTNRRIWYTNQSGSVLQLETTAISNLEGAVAASKDTVAVGDIVICKKDNAVLYVEVVTDTLVGFGSIYGYVNVVAGADGKDGQDGKDGADGFSPTVQFTYFTDPHTARLWITDKNGEKYTDIVSPEVKVEEIEGGHRITVKDVGGTKTFDVMDGAGGAGGTATGLTGEAIVAGDDLNNSKFKSFDGNIKMFYTPNDVGSVANTPEGLEASGVYFPMVISIKGAITHCVQYLIANNEVVSASNYNGETLYDKQVWMRNLDYLYWTPWTKVFPVSGGSGGGSVNNWNDLGYNADGSINYINPDFIEYMYGKKTVITDIFPETTLVAADGACNIDGAFALIAGETYTVGYNGETYESVCIDFGGQMLILGNPSSLGMDDNGMPFMFATGEGSGTSMLIPLDGQTEVMFSISGMVTEVKKVPNEFIDTTPVIDLTVLGFPVLEIGKTVTFTEETPDDGDLTKLKIWPTLTAIQRGPVKLRTKILVNDYEASMYTICSGSFLEGMDKICATSVQTLYGEYLMVIFEFSTSGSTATVKQLTL